MTLNVQNMQPLERENYLKIFNELKSNKVFNHIKEKVTITKKSITFDKFKLLAKKI